MSDLSLRMRQCTVVTPQPGTWQRVVLSGLIRSPYCVPGWEAPRGLGAPSRGAQGFTLASGAS